MPKKEQETNLLDDENEMDSRHATISAEQLNRGQICITGYKNPSSMEIVRNFLLSSASIAQIVNSYKKLFSYSHSTFQQKVLIYGFFVSVGHNNMKDAVALAMGYEDRTAACNALKNSIKRDIDNDSYLKVRLHEATHDFVEKTRGAKNSNPTDYANALAEIARIEKYSSTIAFLKS